MPQSQGMDAMRIGLDGPSLQECEKQEGFETRQQLAHACYRCGPAFLVAVLPP